MPLPLHPLIRELAGRALDAAADGPVAADRVSLGLAPAQLLRTSAPALHSRLVGGFKALATMGRSAAATNLRPSLGDAAGHRRAIYHPLVLHLHLAAFERCYESLGPSLWSACEDALWDAILPSRSVEAYTDAPPPRDEVHLVLWHCLCLLEQAKLLSRDVDIELLDAVVHSALTPGGDHGSLHAYDANESPDTWTYRELTGLHALANLALLRRNTAWARRVKEIAGYHLEHTQPDFTTYEPWALFAFGWTQATSDFAQQQLHDVQTHLASGGVDLTAAALLLADADWAMGMFE